MSIYVYTRVSSSSQKNDSQLSEIKKEIGENKIKDIFCDVISGVSKGSDRPQWSKLNSILKSGDEVVSYRLDRFGRSAVDVISNIKELMERDIKVSILSPKMSFDKDDYFSQFLLTLFSGLSEMERNITKERQKAGIAARREAKKKHPELLLGRRPLSSAVRKSCYDYYLSGMSIFEIRLKLKENHGLSKKPGRQTIYDIIKEFNISEQQKEEVKQRQKARRFR